MRVYGSAAETAPAATDPPAEDGDPGTVRVGIAELRTATGRDHLRSSGFGSCVGVALHAPEADAGGLAHVMLPEAGDPDRPAKYADTAVPALVAALRELGASDLQAKLAGGSDMFEFSSTDESVGERNVAAVEAELADAGIPVVARDVGGDHGRSLDFDVATGELHVSCTAREDLTL
jgi:chemotaxis protein CheD